MVYKKSKRKNTKHRNKRNRNTKYRNKKHINMRSRNYKKRKTRIKLKVNKKLSRKNIQKGGSSEGLLGMDGMGILVKISEGGDRILETYVFNGDEINISQSGKLYTSSNKFSVTESAEKTKFTEALELIKNKNGDTVMLPLGDRRKGELTNDFENATEFDLKQVWYGNLSNNDSSSPQVENTYILYKIIMKMK